MGYAQLKTDLELLKGSVVVKENLNSRAPITADEEKLR